MIVGLDPGLDEVAEKGVENLIIGRGINEPGGFELWHEEGWATGLTLFTHPEILDWKGVNGKGNMGERCPFRPAIVLFLLCQT